MDHDVSMEIGLNESLSKSNLDQASMDMSLDASLGISESTSVGVDSIEIMEELSSFHDHSNNDEDTVSEDPDQPDSENDKSETEWYPFDGFVHYVLCLLYHGNHSHKITQQVF